MKSCSDEKMIQINFDCFQDKDTSKYIKCTAAKFNITASDQNATFTFGNVTNPPQEIVIESSSIFFIPHGIFQNFTNVKEFIARNVSIREIYEETFSGASKLHYLILSYNNIEKLIDKSFSKATELQSLKLQNNQISSLSSHAFFGLTELRMLLLSFNKITFLPLHVFRDLRSLEDLELDNNLINAISLDQFANNYEITTINLRHNAIVTIDADTFQNLTKLEKLNLNENLCVDKLFTPWNENFQSDLNCCSQSFEEESLCLNEKVATGHSSIQVPLILLLFFSIFGNILVISYCVLKKRATNNSPENIELIASDSNGDAYQVY